MTLEKNALLPCNRVFNYRLLRMIDSETSYTIKISEKSQSLDCGRKQSISADLDESYIVNATDDLALSFTARTLRSQRALTVD